MQQQTLEKSLFEELSALPVIDTHEHLPWDEAVRCADGNDLLAEYLVQYLSSDLKSAGMPPADFAAVTDPVGDVAARWLLAEPWWDACRHTGYARALDIAAEGIYGLPGINRDTVVELNRRFLQVKSPGHTGHVLQQLCGIQTSLVDVWTFAVAGERPYMKAIWQPVDFILPGPPPTAGTPPNWLDGTGAPPPTLDGWLALMEATLDARLRQNAVRVVKCAIAYARSLRFEAVPRAEAGPLFDRALEGWRRAGGTAGKPPVFPTPLQDFMMHHFLGLAEARGLTIQFHTGLQEGNGNTLANSDPALLGNLFGEYPGLRFDLFHIGWPWQGTVCALAKMFPNVFIDMCWAHIIAPSACVAALDDFLDAVPHTKLSAFGGDYGFPDGVYGHLCLARQNVARTLAGKVARGVFSQSRAVHLARALFYENPKRIFQL